MEEWFQIILYYYANHTTKSHVQGREALSLTRRIKMIKQVLECAADLRMYVQQMGDGGTPVSGTGAPSDTHILDNQPPSV